MAKADLRKALREGGGTANAIGKELKFEDDYVNGMASYLNNYAKDLQGGIDKYLKIMHNIRENAIIEGDTAKALDTFILYADKLKTVISESGNSAKTVCENFVTIVDKKDASFY